jgi:acyl-CoA reductase-like NAD-dependent aldehyde dehydrogenase
MGKAMLQDARLRKIHFTGSTRVGKLLMQGAAETVTQLSLELGGNAPTIIFPDVNVEKIARMAMDFKYRNAGQVCIAPQRFYVHSKIVEEFIDHSVRLTQGYKLGNGLEKTTEIGPLINARQRERVEAIVATAQQEGGEILTGGSRPENLSKGYFFKPTVMTGIKEEAQIWHDEIFGPVLPITPFEEVEQVIHLANNTEYGLAAYVQTNDLNTAIYAYEHLEFGMVAINDWLPSTPEAPFGGIKQSGMDRECGAEGLESYLETKTVYIGELSP